MRNLFNISTSRSRRQIQSLRLDHDIRVIEMAKNFRCGQFSPHDVTTKSIKKHLNEQETAQRLGCQLWTTTVRLGFKCLSVDH